MATTEPFAGIQCRLHGNVDIDLLEYNRQMSKPNSLWTCPKCGSTAQFDDARFEELNPDPKDIADDLTCQTMIELFAPKRD